jgi:NADH:ubiquinone oxidoreductase subunit 2 (subunit N)
MIVAIAGGCCFDMSWETLLSLLTVALPGLSALLIRLWRSGRLGAQRRLARFALGLTALAALALFLIGERYACTFSMGAGQCAIAGLATLSVILLNAVLLVVCLRRENNTRRDYIHMLLLSVVWATMVVSNNVLFMLLALFLLPVVLSSWAGSGGVGPILLGRDEYKDDWGPKR